MRAIKAAVCAALVAGATPAGAEQIEMVESEYRLMSEGRTIERWSWQALVYNDGPGAVSCRVEASFLDSSGFIVQRVTERVSIAEGAEEWVRGQAVTDRPSGIERASITAYCR